MSVNDSEEPATNDNSSGFSMSWRKLIVPIVAFASGILAAIPAGLIDLAKIGLVEPRLVVVDRLDPPEIEVSFSRGLSYLNFRVPLKISNESRLGGGHIAGVRVIAVDPNLRPKSFELVTKSSAPIRPGESEFEFEIHWRSSINDRLSKSMVHAHEFEILDQSGAKVSRADGGRLLMCTFVEPNIESPTENAAWESCGAVLCDQLLHDYGGFPYPKVLKTRITFEELAAYCKDMDSAIRKILLKNFETQENRKENSSELMFIPAGSLKTAWTQGTPPDAYDRRDSNIFAGDKL